MRKNKGFTLLELIIVVIVIGILASIALPRYLKVMEKARSTEAKQILGTVRSAQMRYYASHQNYTDNFAALDINITTPQYFDVPTPVGNGDCGALGGPTPGCVAGIRRNTAQLGSESQYYGFITEDGNISFRGCNGDENCQYLE